MSDQKHYPPSPRSHLDDRPPQPTTRRATIIIPTGGRADTLSQALASIQRYAQNTEVIVVGNRNDEATRNLLHKKFSDLVYIETNENSAVVKRNIGISRAKNDILVFVDDDVVVEKTWLANLLSHYEDDHVGGVGGRVIVPGIPKGSAVYQPGTIKDGFIIGNWNPPISEATEVQHLIGCNMSLRKGPVILLEGFDNFFRAYNFREETDLCLRVRQLGYRIVFDPNAALFHNAIGRLPQGPRWAYYYVRNTAFLFLKYEPKRGLSSVRFLRNLFFPPRQYLEVSGVRLKMSLGLLVAGVSGLMAGILGVLPRARQEKRQFLIRGASEYDVTFPFKSLR